jgi:uncharacterized membrane protein YfcA
LEAGTLAILCAAAFVTAVLSAIVGLAGGITLLAVMLLFFEPLVVLPVHGVIQLVSNLSRTWFQREHVEAGILQWFAVWMIPASIVGLWIGSALPAEVLKVAIGVFVLLATWKPRWLLLGIDPTTIDPRRRFLALGGCVGFLNMTVGATGPFAAPFFLNTGLSRHALVGTKAATQALGHTIKVVLFGLAGFAFFDFALPLAALCACVVLGSFVGSKLLDRVSERVFDRLYRGVLTAIALRLLLSAGQ